MKNVKMLFLHDLIRVIALILMLLSINVESEISTACGDLPRKLR